jgi:HD-GYP domain-containing protein (c-di-GMP phosphodiesterase class II)
MDIMHNIVCYHHEAIDGSGYLAGLQGEAIPLEARIVTVADVFDALTTKRPYKEAWTDDDAFAFLGQLAGQKFDADCVAALAGARREVAEIKEHFGNAENGFTGFQEAYLEGV